jgi:hypothetical protein
MSSHLAKSLIPSDTRNKLFQTDAKEHENNENLNRNKKGENRSFVRGEKVAHNYVAIEDQTFWSH